MLHRNMQWLVAKGQEADRSEIEWPCPLESPEFAASWQGAWPFYPATSHGTFNAHPSVSYVIQLYAQMLFSQV